jgi:hypothetical protein
MNTYSREMTFSGHGGDTAPASFLHRERHHVITVPARKQKGVAKTL